MVRATTILVDDHPAFRQGLRSLLGQEKTLQVVGEAGGGLEAIELVRKLSPDLVVMDISMPDLDGIEATQRILSEFPQIKVVALSVHSGKRFVRRMLQAGAAGYILKESAGEELLEGLRSVLAGEIYLSKSISDLVISDYGNLLSKADGTIEESTSPILRTKLHSPPATTDIVPRTRLIEQLEGGRDRVMTLISAPAGYGKSILASQWLAASRRPGAWLSLDENDNDQREFLRYFLSALDGVSAGLGQQSKSLLNAAELPPTMVLARYLLNDVEQIKEPLILVLDDYHSIKDQNIHDLLAELLRYPSPNLHLALLTRRDPPLPLGKLRAQGQLTELAVQHLRFTLDETTAFLERILHTTVDEETASALDKKLEGWVTGLRLAAISMGRKENRERVLQELLESSHLASEYLVREVLSQIPPSHSRSLMEISILDRFCASLCDAVSESSATDTDGGKRLTGRAFVDWLEKTHLFVIPLDDRSTWYRFHHLFQDLLQVELKRARSEKEIRAIHVRASQWFEGEGLVDEALKHAHSAEDIKRVVHIVEKNRQSALNTDQMYVLANWLSRIPESVVFQSAELLLARAWVCQHQYRLVEIEQILDQVDSLLRKDGGHQHQHAEVSFFKGCLQFFLGDGAASLNYLKEALKWIPISFYEVRAESEVYYSLACQMEGQKDRAIDMLDHQLKVNPLSVDLRKTRLLAAAVYVNFVSGDLAEAKSCNLQFRQFVERGYFPYAEVWCDYLQGLINLQTNELDTAIEFLERSVEQRFVAHRRAAVDSLVGLMLASAAAGQRDKSSIALQQLHKYTASLNDPACLAIADSGEARLAILQGQPEHAANWLEKTSIPPPEVMLWWQEVPCLTWCRVSIAEGTAGRLREAEKQLINHAAMAEAHHNITQSITILTLLAVTLEKQGKTKKALTILERAVMLAQPGSIIFPFLELGLPMAELLDQVDAEGPVREFVDHLLATFSEPTPVPARKAVRDSDLDAETGNYPAAAKSLMTLRELEILPFLGEGLSNREISERIQVTPETVKKHLKNIFQKLGVGSRARAVVKARSLGILPEDR